MAQSGTPTPTQLTNFSSDLDESQNRSLGQVGVTRPNSPPPWLRHCSRPAWCRANECLALTEHSLLEAAVLKSRQITNDGFVSKAQAYKGCGLTCKIQRLSGRKIRQYHLQPLWRVCYWKLYNNELRWRFPE